MAAREPNLPMRQRFLPPHLFLLCVITAGALHWLMPVHSLWPMPWNLLGILPIAMGIGLLVSGSRRFARAGTNIHTFLTPTSLVTDGVFRISRNPMYLGFAVTLFGISATFGSLSSFAATLVFVLIADFWYIPFEERACEAGFGEAYVNYRARVRRWI